jgi:hypothetical protein
MVCGYYFNFMTVSDLKQLLVCSCGSEYTVQQTVFPPKENTQTDLKRNIVVLFFFKKHKHKYKPEVIAIALKEEEKTS